MTTYTMTFTRERLQLLLNAIADALITQGEVKDSWPDEDHSMRDQYIENLEQLQLEIRNLL